MANTVEEAISLAFEGGGLLMERVPETVYGFCKKWLSRDSGQSLSLLLEQASTLYIKRELMMLLL